MHDVIHNETKPLSPSGFWEEEGSYHGETGGKKE
jgi:hypothetical protein